MKKVLSLALLLLPSQLIIVEGFTTSVRVVPSAFTTATVTGGSSSSPSPSIQSHHHLGANDIEHHHDYDTSIDNNNNNNDNHNSWTKKKRTLHKNVVNMAFVATMSVGILFSSTTIMAPPAAWAADNNSAVKDADIVDFSMPSYQDASRAAVNSNLKGDKFLLGDSNFEKLSITATVVEEKTLSPAEMKAEKEAAKAAMKAARAQQQADAEAAIANKAKAAAAAATAAAESPPAATTAAESPPAVTE
mmetsp:Transcript_28194/g.32412  ORF Transcript_28194/g.32412 Transcript_28194/m.32412 type:complete len:247 (-) Transcript_28194:174-914(-)